MKVINLDFNKKLILNLNNQKIVLNIRKYIGFHGVSVSFGVDAPHNVSVDRKEIAFLKRLNSFKNGNKKT